MPEVLQCHRRCLLDGYPGQRGDGKRTEHGEHDCDEDGRHSDGLDDAAQVEDQCKSDRGECDDSLVPGPCVDPEGERRGTCRRRLPQDEGVARDNARGAGEIGTAIRVGTAGLRQCTCQSGRRAGIERRDDRRECQRREEGAAGQSCRGRPRGEDTGAEHGSESDDRGTTDAEDAPQFGHAQPTDATISPAGCPPPRRTCRDWDAMTSLSMPSARRMPAIAMGRARPEPSSILSAIDRPSGSTTR